MAVNGTSTRRLSQEGILGKVNVYGWLDHVSVSAVSPMLTFCCVRPSSSSCMAGACRYELGVNFVCVPVSWHITGNICDRCFTPKWPAAPKAVCCRRYADNAPAYGLLLHQVETVHPAEELFSLIKCIPSLIGQPWFSLLSNSNINCGFTVRSSLYWKIRLNYRKTNSCSCNFQKTDNSSVKSTLR